MKKILLILSFILTFSLTNVSASTCDSATMKKLKDKANNIKVSYEVEIKTVENENYRIDGGNKTMEVSNIIIDLYNITDDVFVIISNDIDNTKKTIVYSDTDSGKYKLDTWNNYNALVHILLMYMLKMNLVNLVNLKQLLLQNQLKILFILIHYAKKTWMFLFALSLLQSHLAFLVQI